jgi:hypothetical protein
MTEDKRTKPVAALARANGAPDNLAVISYNGCGNLPAARLLASMITDMRPDARIVLHRDRDFRTQVEMDFELATAAAERHRNGIARVTEVFTPLNDIEHSFAQAEHLKAKFPNLAPLQVENAIAHVLAFKRDELVAAANVAREQIRSTIYNSPRKRRKPEWQQCGMPADPPPNVGFVPANGLVPVAFENSHGKILMDGLRPQMHQLVGGATQEFEDIIYSPSDHLVAPTWTAAFNLQGQ